MKKILIIGGGLSGLATGVYACKAGYDVTIIEKNDDVGGLCTTWTVDGCQIDGCIHWLTGSSTGKMEPIYKELGIYDNMSIFKPSFFYKFYYKDITIELSRDIDELENQLLAYALDQNDENGIKAFIKLVKKFRKCPLHSGKPINTMKTIEILGYIKSISGIALVWNKAIKMSLLDLSNKFHSDVLRHFFLSFMPPYYSAIYFIGIVSQFTSNNADTIYNSSKDFAYLIKNNFLNLGGKIITEEEIVKLNIENNIIESIESKNGNKYYADYIINASPLHYFYDKLLPEQYHDKYVEQIFGDTKKYPLISTVYISMKIDKDYKGNLDHFILIYDEEGIKVGSSHNETIHYRAYPYNKNEDGSFTLISLVDLHVDDYEIFKKAKEDGTYKELKYGIAQKALDIFVKKFNDVKDHISIVDVATPLSFENKTNTYKGAYLSNLATPFGERKDFKIKDKYILNLYYSGQWLTQIGGIPRSLTNGKFVIDELTYFENKMKKKIKKNKAKKTSKVMK